MSDLPDSLVLQGNYAAPRTDTPSWVRMVLRRLRDKLARDDQNGALIPEGLKQREETIFDGDPWARLRDHTFELLDDTYGDWLARDSGVRVCACLALPSVPPDLFRDWATDRGHPTGDRPGAGVVVIPQMDGLITRSIEGIDRLRAFATALDRAGGKHLICGTTTQWRFLTRVSALDLVVEDVRQLPAYGADALASLIDSGTSARPLKSRSSGADILARDEDGDLNDRYLSALASQAFGCPWAALELLDIAVTEAPEDEDRDATWVGYADLPPLPTPYAREARFLLHSLMIHGTLPPDADTLPMPCPEGLPHALERAGLIEGGERLRLVRRFTPHIRRTLTEAGFPLDRL